MAIITSCVVTSLILRVIFVVTVIHGIAGFRYAQVSMGLLPLFQSSGAVAIIFTMTTIFGSGYIWWNVRDEVDPLFPESLPI